MAPSTEFPGNVFYAITFFGFLNPHHMIAMGLSTVKRKGGVAAGISRHVKAQTEPAARDPRHRVAL